MVIQFATTVQDLLKLRHHWRSKTPWKLDWNIETDNPDENEIHLVPARRNVLHAGQRDRQTDQPAHQRRTRGQEPAKRPQRGATAAGAKLAPCPRLPDGQRPR